MVCLLQTHCESECCASKGETIHFRKQVYSVAVDVLGLTQNQHRDWFDGPKHQPSTLHET